MPKNVSDWHRQQRKKELQKNKAARIATRDEKVKSEKTEQMVMEEIRKLEKQHNNKEARPHAIQTKIDRLTKELKIVKEESENKHKSGHTNTLAKSTLHDPVYKPLARPEVSVYYDATLNPFGEPPPGKPRLFHRRDGGVTMHLEEAGLPGERIPPPPPRREASPSTQKSWQQPGNLSFAEKRSGARRQMPTPLTDDGEATIISTTANNKIDPSCIPSLPKPSAAVNRSKRKLQVDIWASNEEVAYEDATGTGVEGVVTTADTWWYRDASSHIQGPFQLHQMKLWIQAGFFPPVTEIRSSDDEPWKKIGKHSVFKSLLPESALQISHERVSSTGRDISTQYNESENRPIHQSSIEDRIAALRRESEQQTDFVHDQTIFENSGGTEPELQACAAPLSEELESIGNMADEEGSDDEDDSVQNRIAALRGEMLENEVTMNDEDSADENELSLQSRIAALRYSSRNEIVDEQNVVPVENVEGAIENATDVVDTNPESLSPHRTDDMNVFDPPPAFPLDDFTSYPSVANVANDDGPPAYPVDELDHVVSSYPVDIDYPSVGDYPISEQYPDSSSYPMDEYTTVQEPEQRDMERPRKIMKIDKELVALMPSHLQKRRSMKAKK